MGPTSVIFAITIKGHALGSPDGTGEFGFVAEKFGVLKMDKVFFTLPTGPSFWPIRKVCALAFMPQG